MSFWASPELEPKKSYKYSVSFGAVAAPFLIKDAKLPSTEVSTIEADYTQYKFYYPGKVTWSPVEFTVYDVIGDQSAAKNLIEVLQASGFEFPANSNNKATLSKKSVTNAVGNIIISQLNSKGDVVSTWTLINPFITNVDFGSHGYSEESLLELTLTVQYDWANYTSK
tara:strand:+ start:484 stop:987 length:504 start_codon:yes stop_codon:yes gene_type:complete